MHIVVHASLAEIDCAQWNALVSVDNPFMRYEFLNGLEVAACVSVETGWQPAHIAVYEQADRGQLIGAMPAYIKDHSYGEYIFDWAWADAHHRHGLNYYPKLSNAVPFTPATGERILIADSADSEVVSNALINRAIALVDERNLSSFHSLFCTSEQCENFQDAAMLTRHSTQFHWRNNGYKTFDDFLGKMSSKKRKNIKRERRRVAEMGISYRWLNGSELNQTAVDTMYRFYSRTINYYGAQSYLNKKFFDYLATDFNHHTLFLFAEYQGAVIAGGLYFKGETSLYGRYWGALDTFHSVHFETCYYQAIDWCIANGYQLFEAGAQGEHKLARGLEPSTTYSAHWIKHPQFRSAIDDFLLSEQKHIEHYQTQLSKHSPFKAEL